MIEGIGIDIIEIARVAAAIDRPRFRERVFSAAEREYCERDGTPQRISERYAGRFAAKEAIVKALGCGFRVALSDVETLAEPSGAPTVRLSGQAGVCLAGRRIHVSISHCRDYACAQAIVERQEPR